MGVRVLGFAEARRLEHHWVGEEHVLLALSRVAGPAGAALRGLGATPERIEGEIVSDVVGHDPPMELRTVESPSLTPALYTAFGRAEGLALARGAADATPEDVLVVLLWHAGHASWIVHRLGVERNTLPERLASAGVAIPSLEPDPLDLRRRKRVDVPYEQLMTIVRELRPRLPVDSPFGFNFHPETQRAWIVVAEDVDAESLVAELLAARD